MYSILVYIYGCGLLYTNCFQTYLRISRLKFEQYDGSKRAKQFIRIAVTVK